MTSTRILTALVVAALTLAGAAGAAVIVGTPVGETLTGTSYADVISGRGGNAGLAASLATELSEHAREALAAKAQRRRLRAPGQPSYELPLVSDGMDLAGLYRLAEALREQGAT